MCISRDGTYIYKLFLYFQEAVQNEFATPRTRYEPTRAKQAKKDESSSVLADVVGILQTTANKLGNSGTPDLITTFASYISAKMNTYSLQTRNSVEHAIFEILIKADRGHYESSYRQQDNYPSSYTTAKTARNEEYMNQQPSSVTSLESNQSYDDFNDLM